jgi:hypothetical protein
MTTSELQLRTELDLLKERYRTLSELWEPKSKHHTHLKISKMIDEVLVKIERVEKMLENL